MLFSVGHVRDPAVQYIVAGGELQDRSLYFWSEYSSVSDLVRVLSYSTHTHIYIFPFLSWHPILWLAMLPTDTPSVRD